MQRAIQTEAEEEGMLIVERKIGRILTQNPSGIPYLIENINLGISSYLRRIKLS